MWAVKRGQYTTEYDTTTTLDHMVSVKPMTPTTFPVTLESRTTVMAGQDANFPFVGLCFTDGTATSSNIAAKLHGNNNARWGGGEAGGTITSADFVNPVQISDRSGVLYIRIIWTAANTFEGNYSLNGSNWSTFGTGTLSRTMTPTHIGFTVSTYGGTDTELAAFDYLRVYETDLSL